MNLELATEWLKAAYGDIAVIEKIIKDDFLSHMTAFHSQQCIEKSLKALLVAKNIDFKKIHSIQRLSTLCTDLDLDNKFDLVQRLDSLYTESRYPGEAGLLPSGKPTLKHVTSFYEFALDIFHQVCTILNIDPQEVKK